MSTDTATTAATPPVDDRLSQESRRLIEFLVNTRSEDIPSEVLHESKRCLLDHLGLTIAAVDEPAVAICRAQFAMLGGNPQARAMGTDVRLRVTDAAMVNAIAGHAFDFDDTHVPTILHPTTPLYAAGLAIAEHAERGGAELLAAHAIGYEVAARVSLSLYPEHYDVGWHMTGTTGQLGAFAASARLLGLDQATAVHGLAIAATQAAGHREQFGTMTKPFHAGHAASSGVLAALFAQRGFTGAPDPLQGRRGMLSVMSTAHRPEELVDDLGGRWEIFRNGVKPYACGVVIHPAADAMHELRGTVAVDDIERIDLHVHPLVPELTGKADPRTGLEGKFSVLFACAIVLIEGAASERHFSDANVRRDDVRDLMSRIRLRPDAELNHSEASATALLRSGQTETVTIEFARGTPNNRLSDSELAAKYHDLADPVIGREQAEELESLVWQVDSATGLGDLLSHTVPGARTGA